MTIYLGDGIGDDPPPRHVNPTVSDDGYMAVGGQLVYVGVPNKQTAQPRKVEPPIARQPDADDDWLDLGTQCIYVGK